MSDPREAPGWPGRVPWMLVAIGVVVAAVAEGYVLFAGEYAPYIDWSNHLGLISILAHGDEMGALAYAERSFAPRPYLLFYAVAAFFSFVVSVPAAAKLALVLAAVASVAAMAMLLRTLERPVIGALLAPLVLYGYARGYGFSSFIFTLPLVLLVLATFERLLRRLSDSRAVATFGGALLLCYLGHALCALPAAVAVALRFLVFAIGKPVRWVVRGAAVTALAVVPSLVCAAIAWTDLGPERAGVTLHRANPDIFLWGSSLSDRWAGLGGHMIERGSPGHWTTMYGVAGLFVLLLVVQLGQAAFRYAVSAQGGHREAATSDAPTPLGGEADRGAVVYAVFFALLYAVGPESIGWPMGVWMVYPRYATLGALALFLLPRPRLSPVAQVATAVVAFGLVAHNATLNRGHVANFNRWASNYDGVRAAVPAKATVLALTSPEPGDWIRSHHALGSLYFYHLCDGAAYTAFLFDNPLHPVRMKPDRPQAPPWNNPGAYSPTVHGVQFDYLVLRGRRFVEATRKAGRHEVVVSHQGWVVFKTKKD